MTFHALTLKMPVRIGVQAIFSATAFAVHSAGAFAAACTFVPWFDYQGSKIAQHPASKAYAYISKHVAIDADGAPNAYHPADKGLDCAKGTGFKGLECLANAGYPKSSKWRDILVPHPDRPNEPFVQPADAEFAGYFVSQTSLRSATGKATNPSTYVDARKIPYIVLPGPFYGSSGTGGMGDFGIAINLESRKQSAFVIAEVGPKGPLGEMSMALAEKLGGTSPNPRTGSGAPKGAILYVVFPKSRINPRWPMTAERIEQQARELLQSIGNEQALLDCIGDLENEKGPPPKN